MNVHDELNIMQKNADTPKLPAILHALKLKYEMMPNNNSCKIFAKIE